MQGKCKEKNNIKADDTYKARCKQMIKSINNLRYLWKDCHREGKYRDKI